MKIVTPKTHVNLIEEEFSHYQYFFFLLGPIKGGDDWQQVAYREIKKYPKAENSLIVIPRQFECSHPLFPEIIFTDTNGPYERQTDWERDYLATASKSGCIIGWLPCESKINPRRDGQPYSRDTYGEIGEWRGRMMSNHSIHFVLGAEEKFPGKGVIQRNFDKALGIEFPIHNTLIETVRAGIEKAGLL